jgi:hypothetical protein
MKISVTVISITRSETALLRVRVSFADRGDSRGLAMKKTKVSFLVFGSGGEQLCMFESVPTLQSSLCRAEVEINKKSTITHTYRVKPRMIRSGWLY